MRVRTANCTSVTRRRGTPTWPKETRSKPASASVPTPSFGTRTAASSLSIPATSQTGTCLAAWPRLTSHPPTRCDGNYAKNSDSISRSEIFWASPHDPWDDLLNFIFDGEILSNSAINGLQLIDRELRAFEFCDEGQAKERLRPYVWRWASAALEALETGRARYLQDGNA